MRTGFLPSHLTIEKSARRQQRHRQKIGFAINSAVKRLLVVVHITRCADLAQLAVGHNGDITGSHRHRSSGRG